MVQSDPNSPLHSARTFEELGLKEELIRIINSKNYNRPSAIQEIALPVLINRVNTHFVGQSQAGTGKTAAFGLAILQKVDVNKKCTQYLVLCPTIELARQVHTVLYELSRNLSPSIMLITKGVALSGRTNPQIIVATPGRLLNLLDKGYIVLNNLDMLVIDEADKMVDDLENLWDAVESILKYRPANSRLCLFSATYADYIRDKVNILVPEKPDRVVVHLKNTELSFGNVQEYYFELKSANERLDALKKILDVFDSGSVMIFVNRRDDADKIGQMLIDDGYSALVLHGGSNMTPEERDAKLKDFINFKVRFLVATDLVSRGIDVVTVNLVINYDFPFLRNSLPDFETYVHRMGRTGRFGREGSVISFVYDHPSREALLYINRKLKEDDSQNARRALKKITYDDIDSIRDEDEE